MPLIGYAFFTVMLFFLTLQKLRAEMEDHMALFQQLKDFEDTLAIEREENARQEKERRKMEVRDSMNLCFYVV